MDCLDPPQRLFVDGFVNAFELAIFFTFFLLRAFTAIVFVCSANFFQDLFQFFYSCHVRFLLYVVVFPCYVYIISLCKVIVKCFVTFERNIFVDF